MPNSVKSAKVLDEVKLFCETVTIRGVSRIVQAKQIFVAVCWFFAVLICLALLIWQLNLLIVKYISYPFTTTFEEQNGNPVFPTVTVCNLNPILMAKEEYTKILSWSQHLKNVQNVLRKTNYDTLSKFYINISKNDMQNLIRDLETPGGYFANFPIYDKLSNIDTTKDLVIDYSLTGWDWMRYDSIVDIDPQWDSTYYNCFEINIKDEDRGNIRSMSLMLYINNFPDVVMPGIYQLGGLSSKATGVRIKMHFPDTRGDMKDGISLGPGTESTFYINMANRSRLAYPYNKENCTDKDNQKPGSSGYLYSRPDCMEYCIQQEIVDTCHCISVNHLFLASQLRQANYMLCGNMSNIGGGNNSMNVYNGPNKSTTFYSSRDTFVPEFVEMLACQFSVLQNDSTSCTTQCLAPCKEVYYEYKGLYATWPDVTHHLSVYRRYIKNATSRMINASLFKDYDPLDVMNMNSTLSDAEIISRLNQMSLIKNNFLQINIVFESNKAFLIEDLEMITPQSMLSSIGGTLSLWLGITVMTLAELIEFIFNIIILALKKKNKVPPKTVIKVAPKKF